MKNVFAMHGIVQGRDPVLFAHRGMLDRDIFAKHLCAVEAYAPIHASRDCLTVDDATVASFEAAKLARELGHAVTFFVNPWHIENNRPYMPMLLNVLFDVFTGEKIHFVDQLFWTRSKQEKSSARARMRAYLCSLASPDEEERLLRDCARENGVSLEMPEYLQTISVADLQELHKRGIDIQNHGWQHEHHDALTAAQKQKNVEQGAEWLNAELHIEVLHYAVPFGVEHQRTDAPENEYWYLLDLEKDPGICGTRMLNRRLLTLV